MNVRKAITCCKGCVPPDRHTGCHSECEKYIQQKKEYDAFRALVEAGKKADRAGLSEYLLDHKTEHGKRRKKGQT